MERQAWTTSGTSLEKRVTLVEEQSQTKRRVIHKLMSSYFCLVKDGVDILTMNAEREPVDTESTLELILNTLCRAFQMKPKQAAALLTNNN